MRTGSYLIRTPKPPAASATPKASSQNGAPATSMITPPVAPINTVAPTSISGKISSKNEPRINAGNTTTRVKVPPPRRRAPYQQASALIAANLANSDG